MSTDTNDDPIARHWSQSRTGTRMYDFIARHQGLSAVLARVMWGDNWRSFYQDIAQLADMPPGTRILDMPCGGGVAFRGLVPGATIDYVAADVSPLMLARAAAEAERRGLAGIDYVQTNVYGMPFEDSSFDLCLSYNGVHCFPDPGRAVAELSRVLRPGGQLRGTAIVSGGNAVSALCIEIFRRTDQFGPVGSIDDLERWLVEAGLSDLVITRRGAYALFSGRRGDKE